MPGQARWRARGDRGRHGGGHEGERKGDPGPEGAQEEGCGRPDRREALRVAADLIFKNRNPGNMSINADFGNR